MMGYEVPHTPSEKIPYVDSVFTSMDVDGDGVVTKEEFFTYCMNTNNVRQSMAFLS